MNDLSEPLATTIAENLFIKAAVINAINIKAVNKYDSNSNRKAKRKVKY